MPGEDLFQVSTSMTQSHSFFSDAQTCDLTYNQLLHRNAGVLQFIENGPVNIVQDALNGGFAH
jgi:hypothetical protein